LGGTREALAYLSEHLARSGYLVIHLQHPGSDDAVWRSEPPGRRMTAMRAAAKDLNNALNRPRDVQFIIDHLLDEHKQQTELGRIIDPERIGIAGHSFGAYTVLAAAGQTFAVSGLQDKRIKAAIALSPPVAKRIDPHVTYRSITIPVLFFTGTRDTSPIDPDVSAEDRTIPYAMCGEGNKYLIVLDEADHMVFGGRFSAFGGRDSSRDAQHHRLICDAVGLFFDAHLRSDAGAATRLADGELTRLIGEAGRVEQK